MPLLLQSGNSGNLGFPSQSLLAWVRRGYSFFCAVSLEQSSYCLTVFCLASCPFLAREQPCFICSPFTDISGLPALAPSPGYMRQIENPGNTSPLVLRSLASLSSSLHLSELFYVCFLYNVRGFKVVPQCKE